MIRTPAPLAAALAVVLLGTSLHAQSVEGRVLLAGWEEPVAGARVVLMDADMATTLGATTSGADGGFVFADLAPGAYYLQAQHQGLFSSVSGVIEVPVDAAADADGAGPVVLTLPSPLLERARECFRAAREPGTGVLAGVAFEASSEMPLPYARVRVQWEREGAPRGERTTTADGSGRFALCSVPAGTRVSAWVEALGGVTRVETDFVVTRDAIARLDLPLELGRVASVRVVQTAEGEPDGRLVVQGRVVDAGTGTPVAAAAVVLGEEGLQFVTDRQGRFRFEGVAPGATAIAVRALGYDLEPQSLELPEAASVELELRVSPQALALEPLVVRMFSPEQQAVRAMPHAQRLVAGHRLLEAELRGQRVHDVLRELPGVQIMPPRWWSLVEGSMITDFYGACIQTNRQIARLAPIPTPYPLCEMVEVIFNGMSVGLAGDFLETLDLTDVESMEFLHPLAAGMEWGLRASGNGALVIWTRGRGPHANAARNPERRPR
jgi:hypothetical protein